MYQDFADHKAGFGGYSASTGYVLSSAPKHWRKAMTDRTVLDVYRHEVDAPREEHYAHWTPAGRRVVSTAEFFNKTCALADSLSDLGVGTGDRVMVMCGNRPEWHMVDLAVLDLGAVDVPVYETLTPDQIAYQVNDSGAEVVVVEKPERMAAFLSIRHRCPGLRHLIQIEGPKADEAFAFDDLIVESGEAEENRFWDRAAEIDEAHLATIIYTSGTTGDPKGVMLSHRNLVQDASLTNRRLQAEQSDLALEFLPLCHTAERLAGYCYMQQATSKAYCSVEHAGELIAKIRPNIFFAVPRVYEKVYQKIMERVETSPPLKKALFQWALGVGRSANDRLIAGEPVSGLPAVRHALADRLVLSKIRAGVGGRVKFCITGAAEIPGYVGDFFHAVGIPMVEAYGLTETSPVAVIGSLEPGRIRRGWVGRTLDTVDVRLADDGEILVRGPIVMMGYWNKPEQTAAAFDSEGYLLTGDIGEIDDDGFLRVIDRKKDIIVTSGGKNVAPQPIESRLKQALLVDVAVVIGDRRNFIAALVSPDFEELGKWARERDLSFSSNGDLVLLEEVREAFQEVVDGVNEGLARYEQIKEFRLLPVTLSIEGGHLTPTMKVKRRVVAERFAEIIDDIYSV
jgi:long-chain acyl-CoA synthetase